MGAQPDRYWRFHTASVDKGRKHLRNGFANEHSGLGYRFLAWLHTAHEVSLQANI
jgi:hypothetical protein